MAQQPSIHRDSSALNDSAGSLLQVIRELGGDLRLHPARLQTLTLDTTFDKDLGLDSLARVEFLTRIESRFGVSLPEQAFTTVESPRDLLRALQQASGRKLACLLPDEATLDLERTQPAPHGARTLVDVLHWHAARHPERPHIKLYRDEGEDEEITFGELRERARSIAAELQRQGVNPKDAVSIMLPTSKEYFFTFFGVLLAGAVPVPIYPPARFNQIEDHLLRHSRILANCRAVMLVTFEPAKQVGRLLKSRVPSLQSVRTVQELLAGSGRVFEPRIAPDDLAFLQYTSGSTGTPKGVMLTHQNLLANLRAMGERVQADSSDVFVSWLPLYHDMGLIGAWLGSLYYAYLLVIMSPLAFLSRPNRWFCAVHRYRATLSAAPNFAYELCLKRVSDDSIQGVRLDSLRALFNGAEPILPATLERFSERFAPFGLRASSVMPVYGLAEASLGLAFPPLGRCPVVDRIDRDQFTGSGEAVVTTDAAKTLNFVSCGYPLAGHEVRVLDGAGRELPERRQGRLQFRGPSATCGYFRNPEQTRELMRGDWLDSGDLAYIAAGEVYITGRIKDVIIHAGRNIYPHELEDAVGRLDGIRNGCVAVFGSSDARTGTERLIVVAETKSNDDQALKETLIRRINGIAVNLIGTPPDDVVLAAPHALLKTSSGKIRRSACRELYERGFIHSGSKSLAATAARLVLIASGGQLQRLRSAAGAMIYGLYAWFSLFPLATAAWISAALIRPLAWRWKTVRFFTRALFTLTGTPISVRGSENLPARGSCILVSNHASYLDGLVLVRALPLAFRFVAKSELAGQFVAGTFLRRIHSEFVERFDQDKGVADALRLVDLAKQGESMLFFPEGTLTRMPGLLPFRMGAFLTAAQAGLPVVPVIIRGTRSILRSGSLLPRRGAVSVVIGEPIEPGSVHADKHEAEPWTLALKLRDAARQAMLRDLAEPDLALESPPI